MAQLVIQLIFLGKFDSILTATRKEAEGVLSHHVSISGAMDLA